MTAVLLTLIGFSLDNRLYKADYEIYDERVPIAYEGFKIAHLSDLHSLWFGDGQSDLIAAVRAGDPDIIVLTGDIVDARIQDFDSVAALFDGLTKIAPVYAVSGNHETDKKSILIQMDKLYVTYGVSFLEDSGVTINKDGSDIFIYGLDDLPKANLSLPIVDADTYGLLLYHRSNQFDNLTHFGYGLVLSGHGHGGLIRLPVVGGIVSPDGKLDFSQKYTGGMYTSGTATLIANRGLAGSHNFPRIFNRPEIVFVTLHYSK